MNVEEGKLEHAATALGHQGAGGETAALYYIDTQTKLQNHQTNLLKREMFKRKGLW
jgi:hypothetical protein